ncbi:hypothetical protein BH11PSE12_BH11PSE12_18330 [soil metagenome]
MSYQVLARKYRPKSFETLVGQEHVVRALSHALDQQRLHHAYLFTGTRGVGKTTLSRILAKAFNCETGITSQPCGVCGACTAIDAGRFVDYIEMDAASNRGVDEMAALLEQAVYAPSNARFKVYMIDEVHMLTNHAFNSMLKTLEEPPEHVKFILATTDPQKIPATVLSRCLQFNLKQMPPGHIVGHLKNILGQEHIDFDVPALRLLAQGAHGSMRDALSLTDQAIAYAAGRVTLDAVQSMLGTLDQSYLIRLLDALALQDGKGLLDVADEMAARSLSYKAALQDLGTLLHQIAIAQMVPAALAEELPERADLMRLSTVFGKEEVQLFYQIVVHGRNELALAPDEYAGFSMTLLRMLAFRPSEGSEVQVQGGSGGNPSARPVIPRPAEPARAANSVPNVPASVVRNGMTSPAAASPVLSDRAPVAVASAVAPFAAPDVAHNSSPAPTSNLSSNVSTPPSNPGVVKAALSPAMAALAAARAGSNKALSSSAVARSSSTAVSPTAPATPAVVAVTRPAVAVAPVVVTSLPVSAVASRAVVMESQAAGMDDMPPPWDDDVMYATAPAKTPVRSAASALPSAPTAPAAWEDNVDVTEAYIEPVVEVEKVVPASSMASATPALAANTSAAIAANSVAPTPLVLVPVPELSWDGHWPNLAASLPVRAVAQQLAQQSELIKCEINGNAVVFHLRVPLPTLLSSGSVDKLMAALTERFGREIRVEAQIGAVEQTANAQAVAERAARQVQAEKSVRADSFVQTLMREFGATIVTGSVRPV